MEATRVTVEEVRERMERGEQFTFVDTRNPVAWGESDVKLPGAIRVPADELDEHLSEIPRGRAVITYCTWPHEGSSASVALQLLGNGWKNVHPLYGGLDAWQQAGLPVDPKWRPRGYHMTGGDDKKKAGGGRPSEWDAASYHRLSAPQFSWGVQVLERLPLEGGETVMDAGCGTGRLTALLLERLPRGRVVAVDLSQNMLDEARARLKPRFAGRIEFVRADLASLPFDGAFDGVFSTAAFHWVPDHPRLFRGLFRSLRPGGWLVAQCGGGPNIARLMRRASVLTASKPYAAYFSGWKDSKVFANEATTAERLRAAGFAEVETSLEMAPTVLSGADEFREFLTTVNMHAHLARLPEGHLRRRFVEELTEQATADDPPYSLDYCRLNIRARRPD